MDKIIKYYKSEGYKVINITFAIKHIRDMLNYTPISRDNVIMYLEKTIITKPIFRKLVQLGKCNKKSNCILMYNRNAMSLNNKADIVEIEQHCKKFIGGTLECIICMTEKSNTQLCKLCYLPACEDCLYILYKNNYKHKYCPKCPQKINYHIDSKTLKITKI